MFYIHRKLEKKNLKFKRKLTNSQKNNENERRATKENPERIFLDVSSASIPNNSPKYSTNLFQCFGDHLSENSPTISSLMDTTEVKSTFGTSVLDKYQQEGFLADAESSQKCWYFSCVQERVLRISLPHVEVSGNAPTNWVHVKIFKENMGQMKFHQLIILSIWEMRRVLSSLDEILGEAKGGSCMFWNRKSPSKGKKWVQQENSSLQTIQTLWRTEQLVTKSGSYVKQPDEKYVHL